MEQAGTNTRKLLRQAHSALQRKQTNDAYHLFLQVVQSNPAHPEALEKLGMLMQSAGDYDKATDYYQRALQADPRYLESYVGLSSVLEAKNQRNEALNLAHHAATNIAPEKAEAHNHFVNLLLRTGQSQMAAAYIESILPRFPDHPELTQFYCMALKLEHRLEEARAVYEKLRTRGNVPAAFRFTYETFLPRLNFSAAEIDQVRSDFQASLEKFIKEKLRVPVSAAHATSTFFLAFHHRDNKELLKLYNQMLRSAMPELNYTASHCKVAAAKEAGARIRIAFISAHMHKHSVGACYRGAMIHLAQQPEFEVKFFNISQVMDEKIQEIMQAGVPIVAMPRNLEAAQKIVADYAADIIIYPDMGMHAVAHYLAMARLAKYQCCLQGHPETTGIDTIDYMISSRSYEPANAQQNYTEQLLCNEGIDTVFRRPAAPQQWLTRESMQLPENAKLYACPMAIQKFHPDFDELLAGILARDPNAVLMLFNDFNQKSASAILQRRILSKCDPNRVVFIDWQPLDVLLGILRASDAILDTIYFGGGTTAQYAFAFGLPIVTMPTNYARGRVVKSYYDIMGIENAPIAASPEEYIEQAVRLANEPDYRAALEQQILARNERLFEQGEYGPRLAQLMKDIMAQQLDAYRG